MKPTPTKAGIPALKTAPGAPVKGAVQTFHKRGVWVERPRISPIVTCACGNKYIVARKNQTSCVRCIAKAGKAI